MKKVLIGLGVVAVVVVVAVVFLLGNLDKIVKNIIESSGSELMGVPVKVAKVEISLTSGTGQITGLKIANPPGFEKPEAFRMDLIRLGLDLKSLTGSPIRINELVIDSPVVTLEMDDEGNSNLEILLNNINKNTDKADEKAAEQQPEDKSGEPAKPQLLSFGKLEITGVTVNVINVGKKKKDRTVTIPSIKLKDVGGKAGVTPGKLGQIVVSELINRTLEIALQDALSKQIDKWGEKLEQKRQERREKKKKE